MTTHTHITLARLNVLAILLRSREPVKTAVRIVLVDGLARKDAMAATGMSGPAVSQAVKRYREAHKLISGAYLDAK